MAKTLLTQKIESALKVWHPANHGEYQVDSFRQGFDALEVPVECGSIKSGLVDFVRVQECFTSETKCGTCKLSMYRDEDRDLVMPSIRQWMQEVSCPKDISDWNFRNEPCTERFCRLYKTKHTYTMQEHHCLFCKKPITHYHHVVPQSENGSNTIGNIVGLCTKHHDLVHKDTTWQKKLAKKKTGLNKKYGALSVLNQIIPALTKELSFLFPKHFFATNGKSTYDYRAAHGVSKDHWLDAYCIACSVLANDVCDSNINSHVPYELKQFRRHDRRALHKENMSRVYTLNGKSVATNRHKAIKQTTDSLEELRQRQPNDVCKLKVKEHHPEYRNPKRSFPGCVFLVGKQTHVMQGTSGSHNGKAEGYYDTNGNSYSSGKCKFVAKNEGIVFA